MNSITTGNTTTQAAQLNKPVEYNNHSMMEKMAKSQSVSDEVIARGKSAIKKWMKENGKAPNTKKNNNTNKTTKNNSITNNNSTQSLSKQLD